MNPSLRAAFLVLVSAASLAAEDARQVALDNGCVVTLLRKFNVNVERSRDKHGPSVLRAANGDLLVFHQDSVGHRGGDGFVREMRSSDGGKTWTKEMPAADWRKDGLDALFGEGGCCDDGKLVLFVQRRRTLAGGDASIVGSWLEVSRDDGRTWQSAGPADPKNPDRFLSARSVFTHGDRMYVTTWGGRSGPSALYASGRDDGEHWEKRSDIFFKDRPEPYLEAQKPFEPSYPNVAPCPDGSFLAIAYCEPPLNKNWTRRSLDQGLTWGRVTEAKQLRSLWAPRLRGLHHGVMMVTGRDIAERATVAYFSTDSGKTWPFKLVIDRPRFYGSYAYSDFLQTDAAHFLVFTSSPQSGAPIESGDRDIGIDKGKGDIIGVMLSLTRPAP